MRLTRLYYPDLVFKEKTTVSLTTEQAHYIARVLRLETGDTLVLFNAESGGWAGSVSVMGKHVTVTLDTQVQKPLPPNDIWLLSAPVKKEDWVSCLEKATELGVAAIQPVITEYTQNTRINNERAMANIVESAQQCERTHIPQYFEPKKLEMLLASWDAKRILYAALERADAKPFRDVIEKDKPAAILIGPEGGFSEREKELLQSKPFVHVVSLGPLILRADTATATAMSLYQSA
jgi:16S rRNA (uracil1498-N3)-methyltransferase